MADLNGANGHRAHDEDDRFAWMPATVDIPLGEGDETDVVEISLTELYDDPTELCTLLENENIKPNYWFLTALAYAKQSKMDIAIGILKQGLASFGGARQAQERLSILTALCWMYLWKCREAPRVAVDNLAETTAFWANAGMAAVNGAAANGAGDEDAVKTKDAWLRAATGVLNEAARISPSYGSVLLARGVLSLLRASLQKPEERQDSLRNALRSFDDALRSSHGRNIMAMMGRARVLYAMGKYNDAYSLFQTVLKSAPSQSDPDPRIGIGCCLWQLGHHEEARNAWERALELRPTSKAALMLNAMYWLHASSQLATTDPQFKPLYNKGMQELTQKAFKLDSKYPIANSTFGSLFMTLKKWPQMQKLAKVAIEGSEVSAIASDGWYLLARMAHAQGELKQALEFYARSDQARGGDGRGADDKGYLPAKFGMAQIKVLLDDQVDAKFRLERLHRQSRSPEVMTLLGTLYAEDYFTAAVTNATGEEKADAWKKAVGLLESVRNAWKDPKRKYTEDPDVLLNLARLYETEAPEKSMQCLQHVEKIEIEKLPEHKVAEGKDEDSLRATRVQLPPELLNNIACFHYQAEKYTAATQGFQDALDACVRVNQDDVDNEYDTDSLITSISYNLGRSYEAQGELETAKDTYSRILERHPGYLDAHARLAYIKLEQDPGGDGPKQISEVYHSAEDNLELRGLYGWYLSKAKRKTNNINEDQEQRHMKHTLRDFNKHDHYSLIAMGNVHLAIAREMDRLTEQDKDKRRKMYHKAVEFFAKALELDEKNAYAVQGLAIAVTEDQKNLSGGIQLFTQVREVLKDVSVYMNLGHAFCELKQYSRSIENYEAALAKDGGRDSTLLACLGRTYLLRAKAEKSLPFMLSSLDYSQRALTASRNAIPFKFNVAFVRLQIAQLLIALDKSKRSAKDLRDGLEGLDEAVRVFDEVARSAKPPFPRGDIEQRAVMIRNTMRKQVERALEEQTEFEEANASRLAEGKARLEKEKQAREERERERVEREEEQRRKIMEERKRMQEADAELAQQRAEEERRREEEQMTTDEETGERKKRVIKKKGTASKRRRRENADTSGTDVDASSRAGTPGADAGDGEPKRKKKRRLAERKPKPEKPSKFKSAEFINSEDEDEDETAAPVTTAGEEANGDVPTPPGAEEADSPLPDMDDLPDVDEEEDDAVGQARQRRPGRVVEDEDEEMEE